MSTRLFIILFFLPVFTFCDLNVENPAPDPRENPEFANWLIPRNEILIRNTDENLPPAIDEPSFVLLPEANYLNGEDQILGVNIDGILRAYPLSILNYHEIINDHFQLSDIIISYSPLTGTAAAWDRGDMKGFSSYFTVSKFIYNSNHILFDGETASHWLPMYFECVNGALEGYDVKTFQVIETSWNNWKDMFPGSKVLSIPTGYGLNYYQDPYQSYQTSDSIRFATSPLDPRLPYKEKVHGIIVNDRVKVYPHILFTDTTSIIEDNFQGLSVAIVGNNSKKFIVSFESRIDSGIELVFKPVNGEKQNVFLEDQDGNRYDIFGLAVEGPDKGRQLKPTKSLYGYWFAIAAMYPDPIIQ
jgi:hypothetical protein